MRILLVDDHPTIRFELRHLLASSGFEVVGEAEDAAALFGSLGSYARISCYSTCVLGKTPA